MKSIGERKNDLNKDKAQDPQGMAWQMHKRMQTFIDEPVVNKPQEKVTILIKAEDVIDILDQVQEITIQKLRTSHNDMTAASVHGFCSGYKHALQQQMKEKQEMHDLLLGRNNNE